MKAVLVVSILCSFLMSTASFAKSKACQGIADARGAKAIAGSSSSGSVEKPASEAVVR